MSKKVLIIHAGGPKTGTSSLQNFLENNIPRLQDLGFAYIHSQKQSVVTGNGKLLYETLSLTEPTDRDIDNLIRSYIGECDKGICSYENFAELNKNNWQRLYQSTIRLGVKLKVVFYFRDILPFFQAVYDQLIKGQGLSITFDEWILETTIFHHANSLRYISNELPQSSLIVRHYGVNKPNIIIDFLNILGIKNEIEIAPNLNKNQFNRSLTHQEREILLLINKSLGATFTEELYYFLYEINTDAKAEPPSYNQSTEDFLHHRFDSEIDWINNEFFSGQNVVSVIPDKIINEKLDNTQSSNATNNINLERMILTWVLEKMKSIQDDIFSRMFAYGANKELSDLQQFDSKLPHDFDPLTYVILNKDIFDARVDPTRHYINYGASEGRQYKFKKKSL